MKNTETSSSSLFSGSIKPKVFSTNPNLKQISTTTLLCIIKCRGKHHPWPVWDLTALEMQEYEHLRYKSQAILCHFALRSKSNEGLRSTKTAPWIQSLQVRQKQPMAEYSPHITSSSCAHLHPQPGCLNSTGKKNMKWNAYLCEGKRNTSSVSNKIKNKNK